MTRRNAPAKVSAPRQSGLMARERLFAALDECLARPLVWIDAPPGSGKTALLVSYLEDRGIPALWYQVDAGDSDPASFFHYLSQGAIARLGIRPPALPTFTPDHLRAPIAFARRYFRALFELLSPETVIVIDNAQEVDERAPIHELLGTALAELPAGQSIVALSRAGPPMAYSQHLAKGSIGRIRWEDLRLSLEETRAMLALRGLREDWLARALFLHSEGWVAGIILMLEGLSEAGRKAQSLPAETRRDVFDYFATLFFDNAAPAVRDVLMAVAQMPYVTGGMAVALSGRAEAGSVLDDLYRRRLFTYRREGKVLVYQFHALFQEFLVNRLRHCQGPDQLRALGARGAQLLEDEGDTDAAMELRASAGDWRAISAGIHAGASKLLESGRRETLLRWIGFLPDVHRDTDPVLLYWLALAQGQVAPGLARDTLRRALSQSSEIEHRLDCLIALIGNGFVGFCALSEMETWLDELLVLQEGQPRALSQARELRMWGVLCAALFWIKPWHPWAGQTARRVDSLLDAGIESGIDTGVVLGAATSAVATCYFSGEFELADRIVARTEALTVSYTGAPSTLVWWMNQVGFLRFFQGRYDEALEMLRRADETCQVNQMESSHAVVALHRCAVEFRVLGWAVAGKTLASVGKVLSNGNPMENGMYCFLEARRRLAQGSEREVAQLAIRGYEAGVRTRSRYQEMLFGLLCAELLIAVGKSSEARAIIARSRAMIEAAPVHDCWRAALVFVETYALHSDGASEQAARSLDEALALAEGGTRLYYLRHLESAQPVLLNEALKAGIRPHVACRIIRLFRVKPPEDSAPAWPWRIRIETLGKFSLSVDDQRVQFQGKVPRKTLALLKVIIALGGREVTEQALCDALWSDEEGDAAHEALSITVFRLRKLLGVHESIIQQGGRFSLNFSLCWVDALRFNDAVSGSVQVTPAQWLPLYGGPFLPEDAEEFWSVAFRERLRGRFIHLLTTSAAALEGGSRLSEAAELYLRGIDADPVVEAFHQGLMRCYLHQRRFAEAIDVFQRLRRTLSAVLKIEPSEASAGLLALALAGAGEVPAHGLSGNVRYFRKFSRPMP